MRACLPGRFVTIEISWAEEYAVPTQERVVIPARWSEEDFLRYAQAVHEPKLVEIKTWGEWCDVWVANPVGFSDYEKAVPA